MIERPKLIQPFSCDRLPSHRRKGLFGVTLFAAVLFISSPAATQVSAADKATARTLATEGLQLFQSGEYEQALDRLNRAEQLYSAPTHLLYIARSQEKLGQWVEAAETYRRLTRRELEANAPQAFRSAISAGHEELAILEPRIPRLTVEVQPPDLESLELTINDEPISAAVVGAERPTNPGPVRLEARAPGYEPVIVELELGESESRDVTLKLLPSEAGSVGEEAKGQQPQDLEQLLPVGLFLGLGFGAAIPGGNIAPNVPMGDFFKTGAGMQFYGGMRVGRHFGGKVFVQGYALNSGDQVPGSDALAVGGGLSLIAGDLEPERIGGYGELGYSFKEFTSEGDNGFGCRVTETLSGGSVRLGGTAIVRLSDLIRLTPYMAFEFGSFSSLESDFGSGCAQQGAVKETIDPTASHRLILFGIGGDLMFGLQ